MDRNVTAVSRQCQVFNNSFELIFFQQKNDYIITSSIKENYIYFEINKWAKIFSFKQVSPSADGFCSHPHAQVPVRTCLKLNVNQLSCVFEVFVLLNHLTVPRFLMVMLKHL